MTKAAQDTVKNTEAMMKDAQSAFQTAFDKANKSAEELNAFGKANLEAVMQSNEISQKAAEKLSTEVTEIVKKNFDDNVKAAKNFAEAKTVSELFEKQAAFAQTAFEAYNAQFAKVSELAQKSTQEVVAPLSARVEAAGEIAKNLQA